MGLILAQHSELAPYFHAYLVLTEARLEPLDLPAVRFRQASEILARAIALKKLMAPAPTCPLLG